MANEEVTISPSRTYVVVVHDMVCPNESSFKKILLPESFQNNSKSAKYYFQSCNKDRAILILGSVAYEDFKEDVTNVAEEVIFGEESKEDASEFLESKSLKDDMSEVRSLLDNWNNERAEHLTTYSGILRAILNSLAKKNAIIESIHKYTA